MKVNFNPQEEQTLQTLIAALGNGVSTSAVNPWLQQTLADQAARVQAKKEQMQNWAQQVTGLASSGLPQEAAQTYMDLMTPNREGVPPGISGLLETAYPAPPTNWQGRPVVNPIGVNQYGEPWPNRTVNDPWTQMNTQLPYQQQQSPLYYQQPEVQQQMLAQQQAAIPEPAPSISATDPRAYSALVKVIQAALNQPDADASAIHQDLLAGEMAGLPVDPNDPMSPTLGEIYVANYSKIKAVLPEMDSTMMQLTESYR